MLINYWAGARAAAGIASETVDADTVADALAEVVSRHADPRFARVVRASTVLVDGVALRGPDLGRLQERAVEVEILPPFAGGSGSQEGIRPSVTGPNREEFSESVAHLTHHSG